MLFNCLLIKSCYSKTGRSFATSNFLKMGIKAVLIDLSGTLHVEDEPTPNAVKALENLRATGVKVKFVTNTTKESRKTLYNRLCKIGFNLQAEEIYSSLSAAAHYVRSQSLNPYYLLTDDARQEFPDEDKTSPLNSVVVGLAPDKFQYEELNKAFNVLLANDKSILVAVHQGKYYKSSEGLALGPGCFVKGLEYATGRKAIVIGKPNAYFFESAIPVGVSKEECIMIGDDANDDIKGAMEVGIRGILVKTGKYLPSVVIDPPPTEIMDNFAATVDWIKKNL